MSVIDLTPPVVSLTPAAYAAALAEDYDNIHRLNVDLESCFVPARAAFEATPPALSDADRWKVAAKALASPRR